MIKIRAGKKSDVKKLVELDKISNKEIKWWEPLSKSDFLKILKNKNLLYVGEENREIIAYLSGAIKGKQLILENIFVKKEFRKKGIANKLARKFFSDWKNKSIKAIRLDCPKRLRDFYEKLGFKVTALIMKREF
ncbi:MAG: GNAT family N-acetyltransferase [Candidatus Nanoarchaeia archaeon]|jgi:predicted GNAT family acetyltransferase